MITWVDFPYWAYHKYGNTWNVYESWVYVFCLLALFMWQRCLWHHTDNMLMGTYIHILWVITHMTHVYVTYFRRLEEVYMFIWGRLCFCERLWWYLREEYFVYVLPSFAIYGSYSYMLIKPLKHGVRLNDWYIFYFYFNIIYWNISITPLKRRISIYYCPIFCCMGISACYHDKFILYG